MLGTQLKVLNAVVLLVIAVRSFFPLLLGQWITSRKSITPVVRLYVISLVSDTVFQKLRRREQF